MNRTEDVASIRRHYEKVWSTHAEVLHHDKGPIHELSAEFCVLRFSPSDKRNSYTYATCGMSLPDDSERLEVFLLSPVADDCLCELMTMLAHYHRTLREFGLGHLLQIGHPWLPGSQCDSGLISLPYLDGPKLEWMKTDETTIRFLWLIPITTDERIFCRENGVDALESLFESSRFNYINPNRESVVPPDQRKTA
jgi:hypothetical protein